MLCLRRLHVRILYHTFQPCLLVDTRLERVECRVGFVFAHLFYLHNLGAMLDAILTQKRDLGLRKYIALNARPTRISDGINQLRD